MDIGLFGGTFNPFHHGHIRIIEHVEQAFGLEKIYIIPSATPPHKPDTDLAPASVRYEMVRQSIAGHPRWVASDKELIRKGPSFTIDTIRAFREDLGRAVRLFLLMGSDAFLDITTWRQKDRIFEEIDIIVMLRKGWENQDVVTGFIDEHISKGYIYDETRHCFSHKGKKSIYPCAVPRVDISSSMIRERIKQGKSVETLVPASVLTLIREKDLYQ